MFVVLAFLIFSASRSLAPSAAWPAIGILAVAQGLWLDRMYTVAHEAVHSKLFPGRRRDGGRASNHSRVDTPRGLSSHS